MGANASRPAPDKPRLRIAAHSFEHRYQQAKQRANQLKARLSFRSRSSRVHAVSQDSPTRSSLDSAPGLLASFHWPHRQPSTNAQPNLADVAVQVDPSELTAGPIAITCSPIKWKKGDCIGSGSFGSVYLGLNCLTGELLAIKEVSTCVRDSPHQREALEQLEQELAVLSTLSHCNIVRYYGTERQGNSLFIFLEYVPGGSIASLVHKFGPLDELVVRAYTKQLLSGLASLHAQRIIHRDIKCANLLVDKDGLVKLADLGMAKQLVEAVSVTKSFKGSAFWMAPEVVRQQGHGPAADIWSVGCSVLEMATGKPPWHECTSQVQVIFKIASSNEVPAVPDSLSPIGASFIQLCLQRDPSLRPSAQQLLQHPFVAAMDVHVPPSVPLQLLQPQQQQSGLENSVAAETETVGINAVLEPAMNARGGRVPARKWDRLQQPQQQLPVQGQRNISPSRTRNAANSIAVGATAVRSAARAAALAGLSRQPSLGVKQPPFVPSGTTAVPPGTFRQLQSRLFTLDEAGANLGMTHPTS